MSECCNLNVDSNKNDILIAQLKREIKALSDTTTARLLIQDKKIAETCVYIKENLSNELRVLLDTLLNSGELSEIITSTLLSEIDLLQNAVYPIGHIKRYGAIGDGVTDDTIPLKEACSEAAANNMPLVIDNGTYLITEDITAKNIKNIDITGEIVNKGLIFEVGGLSSDGTGYKINIRKINNLKITGLKNSLVNVDYCEKLHLFADGNQDIGSIAYCQFYGAYCKELILEGAESDTALSWINENVFRIKRVEIITIKGDYSHNNNHFEHINFEKGVLNLDGARNNYFSARCEGGITINSTERAEANFIEKEYYYRSYFGEDVTEDKNGTVLFYPVTKLQSERLLKQIDSNNRHFPVGSLVFNEAGKFIGNNYNPIYRSNLIPIDKTFALKLKSDTANFRVQLNFYDENKNRITAEVDNFTDGKMTYINGSDWSYSINANVNSDTVVFFPGYAKYVEYHVIFGTYSGPIEYLTIKLLKYTNTDINISNTLKDDVYTSVPNSGHWERGQMLYAKNPVAGAYIGIICVEAGSPGVWKNFGKVME